ncbi:MAG: 30S ribosomal protein S13 [Patescibacteria group bacterium]
MIRIAGVNLNPQKHIKFTLTGIKGIGKSNVKQILNHFSWESNITLSSLSEQQVVDLRNYIESNFVIEADLRRQKITNIKRLTDLNTWRGLRHKLHLPVRGQTTRTNSRTCRGNVRNTGGSGKTKAASKT